ncbi:MAG: beta-galactosidase, partial [Bacteroidales bacterium]|nr:beta-galactosidase [Bacteroidales bacterium]
VLAVHLENKPQSSRWYPGAGIIRPVKLIQTPKSCLSEWGLSATTLFLDGHSAYEELSAELEGLEKGKEYAVEFKITGEKSIMTFSKQVWGDGQVKIVEKIENVKPWTPESPNIYPLTVSLYRLDNGKEVLLDSQTKKIGFKTVSCTAEGGFQLNGVTRKLKGVCLHHDLGMIGAAVN